MSEEEGPKTAVCFNFEPQAWRKTVCKNCFKPPNLHTAECFQNGVDTDKTERSGSDDKSDKSAASSLKNKFEQLELDKYKPSSSNTLPRTKKSSGLSLITGKYDELDRKAGKLDSPTKSIPPPTAPKTYKQSKGSAGLMKSKFGSVENVSMAIDTGDNKLGSSFKFGSMENINIGHDKKKDHVLLPSQKLKLNESTKHISGSDKTPIADSQSKHKTNDLLNKLDMFQNEIKTGVTSKSGQTVIHKHNDGNIDIISLPNKKNESVDKDKKYTDQKKHTVGQVADKAEAKSKFQKPELKSAQIDSKDTQSGSSKLGLKSKFELSSHADMGKLQDFKQGKDSLISSKVNTNSLQKKIEPETKSDDKPAKTDLSKSGLKSVQKDPEQNKLPFLKNRLNKVEEKPNSKFENDNKLKPLNDKNKGVSRTFELNLQDKSQSENIKKPKQNFKDQLKSPDPENSPFSAFKDKLKSSTAEPTNKLSPSWKDKLKSPTTETEKKLDLKLKTQLKPMTHGGDKDQEVKMNALKSPIPEENKKPEFKLRDQLKSPTPEENKKPEHKLRDQLKSPTPEEKKKPENKLSNQLLSPTADENKNMEHKLRDQLKSPTPEDNKTPEHNLRDQLKSPTPEDNKKPDITLSDQLKPSTADENKKMEQKLRDQLKSPTPDENKKTEHQLRDQLKSPTPENKKTEIQLIDQLKSPPPEENNIAELKPKEQLKLQTADEPKKPDYNLKDQLKSPSPENDKEELKLKTQQLNSPPSSDTDRENGVKVKAQINSPAPDESKKSESKLKDQLKSQKTPTCQTKDGIQSASPEKNVSIDLNSKFEKSGLQVSKTEDTDSSKHKNKHLDFRSGLKKSNDTSIKDKEPVSKLDTKNKYELPSLKSNKLTSVNEKNKDNKAKLGANDTRGSERTTNKVEPKFKLNKTDSKSKDEKDKPLSKTKFDLPKLKSSKQDKSDDSKSTIKSKYEQASQLSESKNESKNKFQVPNLKKIKPSELEKLDVQVDEKSIGKDIKPITDKTKSVSDQISRPVDEIDNKKKNSDIELEDNSQKDKEESYKLETAEANNSKNNIPNASDISKTHFDNISPDIVSVDTCAVESMRDKQPLHVDTQVFTSSRNKTAGVCCLDDNHLDSADNASGFSRLEFRKGSVKDERLDKDTIINGDIALDVDENTTQKEALDNGTPVNVNYTESAFEQLKAELLNMTERCENLEKENEMLMGDISKKGVVENSLIQQREDVEHAIVALRDQLNSMEDKCTYLESENINLMNDLKAKHDINQTQAHTKEADEIDERLISKEKLLEDMMDENEQLKQDINELKVEMEEMYDSFRDQEAEEFREIQKELEYTAKNCRILQFKLRKMERRNDQNEQDKNQFEDRLRKLQNSFQDRDAVSHIHSLEDELRMAKDVSVRLHDELDLMEDRRGKVEDENRHITELLEQADRKQFRLELEVDKLRDKVVELRQELRAREGGPEGEEPRKENNLSLIGKQSSLDHELVEMKRELYDGKERELDLKDQLQFIETDVKKMQKKVIDLEEENDNLCKQIKTMSRERVANCQSPANSNSCESKTEAEVELTIQLELSEKELSVLKRNILALDEENEMLHREMFLIEKKLKDQDRLLKVMPEPSSPKSYYEDKIKQYEKEANEFRSKLLDKENELEHMYAQIQSMQVQTMRGKHLKSLDLESDYNIVVDLKRQVEIGHQENEALKKGILNLKDDKSCLVDEIRTLEERRIQDRPVLSTLAVAYVETEESAHMRTELQLKEVSQQLLIERIQSLLKHVLSLSVSQLPNAHILEIAKKSSADKLIEWSTDTREYNTSTATVMKPSETNSVSGTVCELNTIIRSEYPGAPGSSNYSPSDEDVCNDDLHTIVESRDPDRLLSVIEEIYSALIERLCEVEMDSDSGEVVPPQNQEFNVRGGDEPPAEMQSSSLDYTESVKSENTMSEEPGNIPQNEVVRSLTCVPSGSLISVKHGEQDLRLDLSAGTEDAHVENDDNVSSDTGSKSADDNNADTIGIQKTRIVNLEEHIDDLRLIILTKEDKNILLEEEVEELEKYISKLQDDGRQREAELLNEMDLVHGRNEILDNLLEIVNARVETAEDELERVYKEINETQDSSVSSDKSYTALSRISDGSDDVFDGSPVEKSQFTAFWEDQFKKRIRSLETLLAEERKKSSSLQHSIEVNGSDVISSAMSDDAKLHMREKELLQSELRESQKHAVLANDQIRSLTEKLKKVETDKWRSPKFVRRPQDSTSTDEPISDTKPESPCRTCADLQSVKDQLCDELLAFKSKAEELEIKIEEVNEIWISKNSASERERQSLELKLAQKLQDCKRLEDHINKLREEDRMKDIFMKERDNNLKDKTAQITRKEELIVEQEDIIRLREDDLQSLFDQISQREKTIKDLTETMLTRDERLKEKDDMLKQMSCNMEEKNEELHYLEEEVHESVIKRNQSETKIVELQHKIDETMKGETSEIETENERLQSDVENLMGNITELHTDKVTLQNELDKAKHALSEAMLMWERDRSSLGTDLNIAREKMRLMAETVEKKESQALQLLRREVHSILESREKLIHELRLNKMEHDNTVRILKMEKCKLTDELTSKIRMLTHEISNNDKMSDELTKLRGQDDINYQLHHHEKILRAEYMAMKVRYETQLERLQKEHLQLLEVVERLQRAKNLDQEIIVGIQKGMANIRQTYSHDLSRWKDERSVLERHITLIEEGKEIAQHLRAQIDALKRQLTEQEVERTDLVNRMTTERRNWDVDKAQLISTNNQLEEQLAVFIQAQSKNQNVRYNMEVAWEKERREQKRLLSEAHALAMDLQDQLSRRDEEHAREKKNLMEQLHKQRHDNEQQTITKDKMTLEVNTGETRVKHIERQMEDLREKQKKEQEFWMKEKGDLLRRLAEMRKIHLRDVHRIDDVLAALKRLRELATIVIESDNSAMLPSNGNDVSVTSGDASAASASMHAGENEGEMADLKQNIDQVILKYVKESLRQIHFLAEELAIPSTEISREDKQQLRRSLSSSEIELLKDEFLIGPQDPGLAILSHHETIPEVKSQDIGREHPVIHRQITHDGTTVNKDYAKPGYIENILMEQSSFYNDANDSRIEVHRVKTTRDVTRVETQVTSLPKPPPSFIIPRSRSTSPAPATMSKTKPTKPVLKSISLETSHSHRLSAPVTGASSRSSSTDSSPVGTYAFIPSQNGCGLYGAGGLQSGSLDRLSPNTARRKFFESQPSTSAGFMSWPDRRKREYNPNRNSRSLTGSTELFISESSDDVSGNGRLRNSVSMDDGAISDDIPGQSGVGTKRSRSAENTSKHSGIRDIFIAMKRRLKPKIKRSQSAREHDKVQTLKAVKENEKLDKGGDSGDSRNKSDVSIEDKSVEDLSHVTQDQLIPIQIPDDSDAKDKQRGTDGRCKKSKSRSRSPTEKDDVHGSQSTLQKIKRRFRSKSADRARDHHVHHVTPILVGHTTTSPEDDPSLQQYSETCV